MPVNDILYGTASPRRSINYDNLLQYSESFFHDGSESETRFGKASQRKKKEKGRAGNFENLMYHR